MSINDFSLSPVLDYPHPGSIRAELVSTSVISVFIAIECILERLCCSSVCAVQLALKMIEMLAVHHLYSCYIGAIPFRQIEFVFPTQIKNLLKQAIVLDSLGTYEAQTQRP